MPLLNISSRTQILVSEISRLQDDLASVSKDIEATADKAARASEQLARAKTTVQISQYTRETERVQNYSVRYKRKYAKIGKEIVGKQRTLSGYQKSLENLKEIQSRQMLN